MTQQEYMTLSKIIEAKDSLDTEIISSTINMVSGLNLETIVFRDKKAWEDYFGKSLNLAKSLLKANEHCRKYVSQEKKFLKEYRKKCIKDKNTNIFLATEPIGLNTEIDGFLSQVKAALDTLATTLNPLLGWKLNGWHKTKKKSGLEIISSLENNLNNVDKVKAGELKKIIENNIEWITYIVDLRDKVHHKGGLKCVTEVVYDFRFKKAHPQRIKHSAEAEEEVRDFLLRTLKDINIFINQVLIFSILIKAPGGMAIRSNEKGKYPPYNWVILKTQVES